MKTKLIICLTALLLTAQTLTARRLVFIGLDGWAGNTYEQSDMPYVKQLAAEGAMTLEKRAVLPSSSAINWASIFMGAGPEVHGYLNWGSKAPEMQQPTGTVKTHNIFPTVFQLARQQKPDVRMGLFYEWDGIKYLTDTLAFDHHEQTKDGHTAQIAAEYIKANKPDVTVIVFDNPDHTGHSKGWGSPEYYATMTQLDKDVATIISAVKEAGMADDTVVMVTGDHGGSGTGHGGTSMAEVNSPLILWGAGIQPGTVITDMVIGYDLAATMAHIIGIDTPRCWRGRTIDQAFEGYLPRSIYSGLQGKHHVQGIAVDIARGYVYFSFTTRLVKTDMQGRFIGSIEGLTGHLGCLALNPDDGKIYASLEYKDDAIGRGISGEEATKRDMVHSCFRRRKNHTSGYESIRWRHDNRISPYRSRRLHRQSDKQRQDRRPPLRLCRSRWRGFRATARQRRRQKCAICRLRRIQRHRSYRQRLSGTTDIRHP